uniref:Bifunctional inhibitor/plant lipid transfer protein/seed storage helical domain-containing protein n=1 Tax=Oryza punctata TaxID=4537 RepID=A0A0E0M9G4_ORYPU
MAKWAEATVMLLLVAVAVVVAAPPPPPPPPECDPGKLSACAGPIFFGSSPSKSCCSNLRAQEKEGCFCSYASDPAYASYINSTNARKTIAACGIAFPSCLAPSP